MRLELTRERSDVGSVLLLSAAAAVVLRRPDKVHRKERNVVKNPKDNGRPVAPDKQVSPAVATPKPRRPEARCKPDSYARPPAYLTPRQRRRRAEREKRVDSPLPRSPVLMKLKPKQLVIGCLVGSGGEADVYKAELNGKTVAVKVFQRASQEAREFDVYRTLGSSPYFLKCYVSSQVEVKGSPKNCIVMEYCDGGSIYRKGRRSIAETCRIGEDVSAALLILKKHGLVHLDVKAPNIMHPPANGGPFRLSDFGFVKTLASCPKLQSTYGTKGFTAPEIVLHGKPEFESDVFSLGATLVEMASGQRFFHRQKFKEVAGVDVDHEEYYKTIFNRLDDRTVEQELDSLGLPARFTKTLAKMLRLSPCDRLSIDSVRTRLELCRN